jgi:hypothetical protein
LQVEFTAPGHAVANDPAPVELEILTWRKAHSSVLLFAVLHHFKIG